MRLVDVKPPQIAFGLVAVGTGVHFLLPESFHRDFSCLVCALISASVGFGVMMWAWWHFRRVGNPIRPTDNATTLLTDGPYRLSRNPMYLGIVLMLLGIALLAGSWPMLLPPLAFAVIMSSVFIPYEEKRLSDSFGEAYDRYSQTTRRWIGWSREPGRDRNA